MYLDILRWVKGKGVVQEAIFPWSIGPNGAGYRYDIAVPELKVLVEYDSTLHSRFIKHFHRNVKGFLEGQSRDEAKNRMAKRAGWTILRVDERVPGADLAVRAKIERKMKLGG